MLRFDLFFECDLNAQVSVKLSIMTTFLLAIAIVGIAFAGIAIKIIFKKDGEFNGTCATNNPMLKNEIGECTVCGQKPGDNCEYDEDELGKTVAGKA